MSKQKVTLAKRIKVFLDGYDGIDDLDYLCLLSEALAVLKRQPEPAKKYGICLACGNPFSKDEIIYIGCIHKDCYHQKEKQSEPTEFTKNIQDALKVMSSDGKFHRKIMEKACDIIDRQAAKIKELEQQPTDEQLKTLRNDIMSGLVMTTTVEHYEQLIEQIERLKEQLGVNNPWHNMGDLDEIKRLKKLLQGIANTKTGASIAADALILRAREGL